MVLTRISADYGYGCECPMLWPDFVQQCLAPTRAQPSVQHRPSVTAREREREREMGAPLQLPKIDFSGLYPASPGGHGWDATRTQVMEALCSYGCFEAVYERITPAIRETLFGAAMKEVFGLPLDFKIRNISDKPFHGYVGQIPGLSYESLAIMDASLPEGMQSFTHLLWPEGNPSFCEMVGSFARLLAALDGMVRRMVLESLGVDQYYESHMESNRFLLRLSQYGAPQAEEKQLGLVPHRDKNTLAIVCQNQVDGLEMETPHGHWIPATPSPASFIVIAGDSLRAWTNGRVCSPLHRIVVGGSVTRYSAILFSIPADDLVIQALPELVDDQHPTLYKPYSYGRYVRFCMTPEGMEAKCQLDAYCGVGVGGLEEEVEG